MHLDERREARICHHIKAIEALIDDHIVCIVYGQQGRQPGFIFGGDIDGAPAAQALLAIASSALRVTAGMLPSEST